MSNVVRPNSPALALGGQQCNPEAAEAGLAEARRPGVAADRIDPAKFRDPTVTAKGERRAVVGLSGLKTLWINTGTLCNLACTNCYIESTPRNDRLAYISAAEVA